MKPLFWQKEKLIHNWFVRYKKESEKIYFRVRIQNEKFALFQLSGFSQHRRFEVRRKDYLTHQSKTILFTSFSPLFELFASQCLFSLNFLIQTHVPVVTLFIFKFILKQIIKQNSSCIWSRRIIIFGHSRMDGTDMIRTRTIECYDLVIHFVTSTIRVHRGKSKINGYINEEFKFLDKPTVGYSTHKESKDPT